MATRERKQPGSNPKFHVVGLKIKKRLSAGGSRLVLKIIPVKLKDSTTCKDGEIRER